MKQRTSYLIDDLSKTLNFCLYIHNSNATIANATRGNVYTINIHTNKYIKQRHQTISKETNNNKHERKRDGQV